MNRKRLVAVVISAVLAVGLGTGIWAADHHTQPAKTTHTTQATQKPTTDLTYKGVEGKTALDLLKQHATVATKDSSYGPYVQSINGMQAGSGKYWMFYVNGQEASVGANAYITKAGDTVEWKLQ